MVLTLILSYTIWMVYSFLEGVREAFSLQTTTFKKIKCANWSTITFFQRFIFFLLLNYFIFSTIGILFCFVFSLGMIPLFYYIQNGTYFLIRNKMNPDIFKDGYSSDSSNIDRPSMYLRYKIRKFASIFGIIVQTLNWFI